MPSTPRAFSRPTRRTSPRKTSANSSRAKRPRRTGSSRAASTPRSSKACRGTAAPSNTCRGSSSRSRCACRRRAASSTARAGVLGDRHAAAVQRAWPDARADSPSPFSSSASACRRRCSPTARSGCCRLPADEPAGAARSRRSPVAQARPRSGARIQQAMLPDGTWSGPGVEAFGLTQPANTVGGDFYDILPQPDGTVIVALGDVAGKASPAALLMALLLAMMRTLVDEGLTIAGAGASASTCRSARHAPRRDSSRCLSLRTTLAPATWSSSTPARRRRSSAGKTDRSSG